MVEEQTFLRKGDVTVTRSRIVIGNQTYPVANIMSIRTDSVPPNRLAAFLIGIFGAIVAVLNLVESFPAFVFGAALVVIAVIMWRRAKATHTIFFGTSGGEKRALVSENGDYVRRVSRATDEALVASR